MTKRDFSKAEIMDLIDDAREIASEPWRWGRRVRYVFEADGVHWATWIDVHHDDGLQIYDSVSAIKVHQVEKTVKVWEPAP